VAIGGEDRREAKLGLRGAENTPANKGFPETPCTEHHILEAD